MKKLLTLALLTFASSALAQTNLTYYSFTTDATHMDDMKALIATFEKDNPGVKINLVTAPFDSYFTKLQTDIAAGSAPDVFDLNYENFVTFASKNAKALFNYYSRAIKSEGWKEDMNMAMGMMKDGSYSEAYMMGQYRLDLMTTVKGNMTVVTFKTH